MTALNEKKCGLETPKLLQFSVFENLLTYWLFPLSHICILYPLKNKA